MEGKIKKSNDNPEEKYEVESVKRWKNEFRKELTNYLDLPDDYNNTLVRYLIHAKELEQTSIDYFAVNRILY